MLLEDKKDLSINVACNRFFHTTYLEYTITILTRTILTFV